MGSKKIGFFFLHLCFQLSFPQVTGAHDFSVIWTGVNNQGKNECSSSALFLCVLLDPEKLDSFTGSVAFRSGSCKVYQ